MIYTYSGLSKHLTIQLQSILCFFLGRKRQRRNISAAIIGAGRREGPVG